MFLIKKQDTKTNKFTEMFIILASFHIPSDTQFIYKFFYR